MIQRALAQIAKEDIESLVNAKVSEKRTLDYKQHWPDNSSEGKREFLYDVSSFANALGGDLVFGIEDERDADGKATGLPASACGVAVSNVSSEIARFENLIRDGIAPRIQGIGWQVVEGFRVGPVIVMRVPRSLFVPHMVVFGGMARFYGRNSTGKYPMEIGEIRSAFVESTAIGERLQAFRNERLAKIMGGDTLLGSFVTPKVVVHLVPLVSLGLTVSREVTRQAARLQTLLPPMKATSYGGRYNFDGYLVSSPKSESYVQVFRSGIIEAAALPFRDDPEQYKNKLPSIDLERTILEAVSQYLDAQNRLSMPLPIFAAISLLGVRNYRMPYGSSNQGQPIDRDNLLLPEVLIEEYGPRFARYLRPSFDALWQACGHEQDLNYDEDGDWRQYHS